MFFLTGLFIFLRETAEKLSSSEDQDSYIVCKKIAAFVRLSKKQQADLNFEVRGRGCVSLSCALCAAKTASLVLCICICCLLQLRYSSYNGFACEAKSALFEGAQVNHKDLRGRTPLHFAVSG